ncbi:VOC family protein [Fontisubflavum oceani]|uniref:VOC family protein n=1 Tax=Fontisubflavum oceani TaxID=2978973 RepID=UPI0025B3476E|nr:VOC family protein [Fontisubflavum oceani]WJY21463.1 VOC family protein [Fontisubflavum oceani]
MADVIGVGGVFLHCADPDATKSWYARVLGMVPNDYGGFDFGHRESAKQFPEGARTIFAPFAADSEYFKPSTLPFMLNLMVDDLDGMLARAKAEGVEELQPRENLEYGQFGWILDHDGRKIELWQPPS